VLSRAERSIVVRRVTSEVPPRESNSHPSLPVIAGGGERLAHRRLCLLFVIVRVHRTHGAHHDEHCGDNEEPVGRTTTDGNKCRASVKKPPPVAASTPERMPYLGRHATNRAGIFALRRWLISYLEGGNIDGCDEQSLHPKSSRNRPP
jgi:hypothetical protein